MNEDLGLVVLITGASSGIGQACAKHLCQKGHRVYGTSRQVPSREPTKFEMISMDVNDEDSVHQSLEIILSREGRLDVVVNSAGYSLVGSVEDTSLAEAQAQFETNFFGVMRVCRAVLPTMRHQQRGCIVNISSIGGLISIPFQGLYCASKFALEGFTEALRGEARPYGIRVVLIEPGDFHTNFTVNRRRVVRADSNSPYFEKFNKAVGVMESDETSGPSPERIAVFLERIVNTSSPRLRYLTGSVLQRLAVSLKKVIPYKLFELLLMKYYRLL
jgi:NAD(P)-dependent dehydrogenase (short-subunit alcohol dehydrogenase family)